MIRENHIIVMALTFGDFGDGWISIIAGHYSTLHKKYVAFIYDYYSNLLRVLI